LLLTQRNLRGKHNSESAAYHSHICTQYNTGVNDSTYTVSHIPTSGPENEANTQCTNCSMCVC